LLFRRWIAGTAPKMYVVWAVDALSLYFGDRPRKDAGIRKAAAWELSWEDLLARLEPVETDGITAVVSNTSIPVTSIWE